MSSGSSWDIASGRSLGSAIKDNWYMITLRRNATTFTAYRNGEQTDAWTSSLALKNATSPIEIGRTQATYYHKGKIDDVRIYSRALTSNEITTLYNGSIGTEEESIINTTYVTITNNNTWNIGDVVLFAKDYRVNSMIYTGDAYSEAKDISSVATTEKFADINYKDKGIKGNIGFSWLLKFVMQQREKIVDLETENARIKTCTKDSKDFAEYQRCVLK